MKSHLKFYTLMIFWIIFIFFIIIHDWKSEINLWKSQCGKNKMRFYKVCGPIVRQGKRVAAIFHLSTTTRAKQIESIVSRHCWNSFSHFIRFSLNWLKTCAKYFKMLQLVFILLFIFSSRNSHLLKLVWNSYVYLWQQNLSIVPTIFFTGAQFILGVIQQLRGQNFAIF